MATKYVCATCGHFGEPKGFLGITPSRKKQCEKCDGENLIPPDSPVGQKMLAESGRKDIPQIIEEGKKNKARKTKWKMIALLCFLGWFGIIFAFGGKGSSTTTQSVEKSSPFGNYQNVEVGDNAYLWIEHDPETRGLVCLGRTKDDYDKIGKAFIAKDFIGLLEIPGAFCVGSGSRVQLIEKDFPLRRVRILKGAGEVDSDKVGISGWTAMEFVVKQ